jgi:cytochrome c-type biogenesis protein CcmH/NrfG
MKRHYGALIGFLALVVLLISVGISKGLESQKKEELRAGMREARDLVEAGKVSDGVERFRSLTHEDPENTAVWLNLGIALTASGDLASAKGAFEKVLQLDPKDYDATAELAQLRAQEGETASAFEALESIPSGEGQLKIRLDAEPWWSLRDDPKVQSLRKKHGLP